MILTGQELVDAAWKFAEGAHFGEMRKDGVTPYIAHPREVARRFREAYVEGGYRMLHSEDEFRGEALAALHDVLENTRYTLLDLEESGFQSIAVELALLTHVKGESSYLDYLLTIRRSGNHLAIQVKLADMAANTADLDNLRPSMRESLRTKWQLGRYVLTHS